MASNCLISSILFYLVYNQHIQAGTFSVDYTNHQFIKDGKPFQYISGSIHYFRVHPDLWNDRLQRIRAMGLNAIQIYAPWNLHEPTPGNFDFSDRVNLTQFLTLAQQNDLSVLFRAGPFINAEFDNGGFPDWLLKYDNIKLRSLDTNYTKHVQSYFNKLFDVINPFLYKNGGPILMIQIENEYGLMKACDHNYTIWLRDLAWGKLGNDTVLYTTDTASDSSLTCGAIPGTVTTVDFPPTTVQDIDSHFGLQDKYSNGAPHVCSEFYTAWVQIWGQTTIIRDINQLIEDLNHIYYVSKGNTNLYLIHGGDNFDFWNGAHPHAGPVLTAYWTHSPIAPNGNITEMYLAIRNFTSNIPNWDHPPTPIPNNNPSSNYGQITLKRMGASLVSTLTSIQEACQSSQNPMTFEQLDHPYGYVLYTTTLTTAGKTFSSPNIQDNGYVFINNNYQGMLSRSSNSITLTNAAQQGDTLRILVENYGRDSGWSGNVYPLLEYKGLSKDTNNVTLDGVLLQNWFQCGINLTRNSVNTLIQSFSGKESISRVKKAIYSPGVYVGQFDADVIQDTFFDPTGWHKGQLFINGYNLGRYWPTMGPQVTLYVPKPFLQQKNNTVLLIELVGAEQNYVNFIDHSIFSY